MVLKHSKLDKSGPVRTETSPYRNQSTVLLGKKSKITLKLSFWNISSGIIDLKSSKSEVIELVSSEANDDADEKSDIC